MCVIPVLYQKAHLIDARAVGLEKVQHVLIFKTYIIVIGENKQKAAGEITASEEMVPHLSPSHISQLLMETGLDVGL